jgi:hypothetical protein
MSDKTETVLVWSEVAAILVVLFLVFEGWKMSSKIVMSPLEHLLSDKLFDIVLALFGTWLGYWLARKHLEHFVSGIVKKMDDKYLELNKQIAFRKAVAAMLPELPQFYLRPATTFSTNVATAMGEFTSWATAIDKDHTPDNTVEMVSKEAYIMAASLIEKDMGYKEEKPTPNYEWTIQVNDLPTGWEVKEAPDLSIYDWNTGLPVHRYALMEEVERTATTIRYAWKWSMKDVPCGVYVGVVNFQIGGKPVIANTVGDRVKIFLRREGGKLIKSHETIPWE